MDLFKTPFQLIKNKPELISLLIIGYILRIIGTNPGYYAHGDEIMYGEAVYMILNGTLGMEPQILGYYPPLVAWIMLVFFVLIFIPLTVITQIPELLASSINFDSFNLPQFLNNYIFGINWANAVHWGRYITVFFSTGIIVLTYLLAKKIFKERPIAFLAAFFVTVNYRLILNSKIGFIDIYNIFFLLTALLAIIYLYQKPTFKNYLLAWITIGLSFLVKYQVYSIPAFLGTHFLISCRNADRNPKKFTKRFLNKGFLIGGFITFLFVVASHYYHFQHWDKVRGLYEYQALKYGLGINNLNIFPISYIYHVMLGPIATFTALGGLALGMIQKKYRIGTIVLVLPVVVDCFIYFYYSTGGTYTRNLLVILPIALIFSALFFNWAWGKFVNGQEVKTVKIATALVLIFSAFFSIKQQLQNAVIATQVLANPSPRILIEKWVNDNLSKGTKIGIYSGSFSPNESEFSIRRFSGINESLSFQELKAEDVEYSIVDFYIVNNSFVWWMGQPTDIGLQFWKKPDNLLSQSYSALAIRELLAGHTVQVYLPKWQAPGYNYAVVKLEDQAKTAYDSLNKYDFDSDAQGWKKIYYFNQIKDLLLHSTDLGSLVISNENILPSSKIRRIYARPGALRWQSPAQDSQGIHSYKVTGKIKSSNDLEKPARNGFIRLDFYSERPNGFESRAIASYVSERVFGKNDWYEVAVSGISPESAKFFTVGFQVDQGKNPFYLDEIEIFKSKEEIKEPYQNPEYTILDDDLFNPNDGGFL